MLDPPYTRQFLKLNLVLGLLLGLGAGTGLGIELWKEISKEEFSVAAALFWMLILGGSCLFCLRGCFVIWRELRKSDSAIVSRTHLKTDHD